MSNSQSVTAEVLQSLAEASITSSFQPVGVGFTAPVRIMTLVNNTDGDMIFSLDGVNNNFFVPKNSFRLYDFCTNRQNVDQIFALPTGAQIYVKYSSMPSTGAVYVEGIYGIRLYTVPGGM